MKSLNIRTFTNFVKLWDNMNKNNIISSTNAVSGGFSVLGSYQICHNICLSLISLLSLFGITIIGMPLIFLTKIATPFWVIAFILLISMIILKLTKMKGLSTNIIIFNSGLIVAGTPFNNLQIYKIYFLYIGGAIAFIALLLIIKNKFTNIKWKTLRKY